MQDILLYGFSTFLPSILKAMNYDTLQSNYLTIPVYLWGAMIFLCLAWVSDRYEIRGPVSCKTLFIETQSLSIPQIVMFANVFGIIGYVLLLTVKHNGRSTSALIPTPILTPAQESNISRHTSAP
jgi:MFS transporter, ACS family, DAL5 transporter family protein